MALLNQHKWYEGLTYNTTASNTSGEVTTNSGSMVSLQALTNEMRTQMKILNLNKN